MAHYLVYGHGGAYNHGSEAITSCTIRFLKKICPECSVTLSSHFPEQDREFGLGADEVVTRNMSGKTNEEVYKDTLDRITSDTTVIHAAGDNYCYVNWQRYAKIHETAKERGCKSVLWSCSIDEEVIDEEMLQTLKTHDLILARECVTFRTLKNKGLQNVLQVSDIAFTMEPEEIDFPLSNYVVLNLSPLVCRKNPEAVPAMKQLIEYILQNTEYNIALVPHVVMPADNDYEVLTQLYQSFDSKRLYLVSDKLSARQYKSIVSKAQLCVASRTHVTIAAYSTCVPTLAIGYSTKAKGIAEDLGFSEYVVDIMDETIGETLLERYKKLLEEKEALKQRMVTQMPEYRSKALSETVVSFLKGE